MQTMTPAEFARKLGKVASAVTEQDGKAIQARATVTQQTITRTAETTSGLARKYARSGRWVRTKPIPPDAALVNLRGGFAFLAERGSWHYPSGWDMIPTDAQALSTPYGPFASVRHPALKAHPFWQAGVEASRRVGAEAFNKSMRDSIAKAVR